MHVNLYIYIFIYIYIICLCIHKKTLCPFQKDHFNLPFSLPFLPPKGSSCGMLCPAGHCWVWQVRWVEIQTVPPKQRSTEGKILFSVKNGVFRDGQKMLICCFRVFYIDFTVCFFSILVVGCPVERMSPTRRKISETYPDHNGMSMVFSKSSISPI